MTYRIAEVAELVGVPTTTLRYYEDIGLVEAPARGANGYRSYSDADVDRLKFVTATKNAGLALSDVAELVKAYGVQDCSVVAHQVVELVQERLTQTQARIGELVALAADLQSVAARLATAPAAGPCGPDCPCATASSSAPTPARTFVELTQAPDRAKPEPGPGAPIACSLDGAAVPDRVEDWQAVVARAIDREPIPGGVALTFDASPELAADLARLAAAEQDGCNFFTFTVRLSTGRIHLEVQAPPEAAEVVAAMFGPTG